MATLRAKARRHGTQTSQYRGVSLLKQTGKWHGQINVGGKQLHLGFFSTEELAARAYDRAAIHKASVEGGVIVTNLDISEYRGEIEKLQQMTRQELLSMIADEKKTANTCVAGVGGRANQPTTTEEETSRRDLNLNHQAADLRDRSKVEMRDVSPGGSSQDTDTDGGGSGGDMREQGGGGASKRPVGFEIRRTFGRRSKSSSSSQLTHHDERDGDRDAAADDTPPNAKSLDIAPPERESPVTSPREPERLHPITTTHKITGRQVTVRTVQEASSKKSSGGERSQQQGTKRAVAEIIQSPSPRAAGKQRRTKQAPRQAPIAA